MTNPQSAAPGEPSTGAPLAVAVRGVTKVYRRGIEEVRAIDDVTFDIRRGEFLAITGHSGAGKTTLLQLIGAMDTPTSGSILINGHELADMQDSKLTRLRRDEIGFVFQHFGLLPTLTVAENVALPASFGGKRKPPDVKALLERVSLQHRMTHRPSELSGGEMQRVAIARALVNGPSLLLADEPTGNLDSGTSERIIDLLQSLNGDGLTVVVVTHNEALAAKSDRRLLLRDGKAEG